MHGLETIIARNEEAAEKARSKSIVREALLLVANNANAYLKMRVTEALQHLEGLK